MKTGPKTITDDIIETEDVQEEGFLIMSKDLRSVDKKRINHMQTLVEKDIAKAEKWYVHSVLAQCFLPYRDQKDKTHWHKENGNIALTVTADTVKDENGKFRVLGLPFGAKPRLFLSKIQTEAIRNQSPVIPVESSMSGMMKELGFSVTGGTIRSFKEQASRLAACRFRIITNTKEQGGTRSRIQNTDLFKEFELWFPTHPDQETHWPTEIILTNEFYENLKEHAIPYHFEGLRKIQNNSRAIDIYLWMTQRLHRIPRDRPLFLGMPILFEMFGGGINNPKNFTVHFKASLLAAQTAYPDARVEESKGGYVFKFSPSPIPKVMINCSG